MTKYRIETGDTNYNLNEHTRWLRIAHSCRHFGISSQLLNVVLPSADEASLEMLPFIRMSQLKIK